MKKTSPRSRAEAKPGTEINRLEALEASNGAALDAEQMIEIPQLRLGHMKVPLLGTSPIYFKNNYRGAGIFGDSSTPTLETKGKKRMTPEQEALASLHLDDDNHISHQAGGFKGAMVHAISQVKGLTKLNSSGLFGVIGEDRTQELVRIYGTPEVRFQVGKNDMGASIPMYRMFIIEWACTLHIEYAKDLISEGNVGNLLSLAGYMAGTGDRRVAGRKNKNQRGGQWKIPSTAGENEIFEAIVKRSSGIVVLGPVGKRTIEVRR